MKYTNRISTEALKIPFLNSFDDLASVLSLSKTQLYVLVNIKNRCYSQVNIPKKDGSYRTLYVPSYSMKIVQKWIYEEILKRITPSDYSRAFILGKEGVLETIEDHINQSYVLCMDLHDFFNSIKKKRVFYFFLSLGYNVEVANLLTELCTYEDVLPQGAVTSPYLSNLLCYRFDSRLSGLCKKRGIIYSRYADDLYFSSNNRVQLLKIIKIVSAIAKNEGFEVNNYKTRFFSNNHKKLILGVCVNDNQCHVLKEYKRLIRAEIFNCMKSGDYSNRNHILGKINYVNYIENGYSDKIKAYVFALSQKRFLLSNSELREAYKNNKFFKDLPDCW